MNSCGFLVLIAASFGILTGEKIKVGKVFDTFKTHSSADAQGIFLLHDQPFKTGVVYQLTALVIKKAPVSFQQWRPYDTAANSYQFIKEYRFDPQSDHTSFQIGFKPSEYFFMEEGDRIAVYNEASEGALGWKFDGSLSQTVNYAAVEPGAEFTRGDLQTFESLGLPYAYSFSVMYDTDVSAYSRTDGPNDETIIIGIPKPPPTPTPPVTGSLVYTGTALLPRSSYMSTGSGSCLLSHKPLETGVVISFYTYAVQEQPVVFTIWRPVPQLGADYFRLAGQYDFYTTKTGHIEAKLETGNYIFVEKGDRLGFLFMDGSRAVGYNFDPAMSQDTQPKCTSFPDDNEIFVGQNVQFNAIGVPYDFAIGAILDTVIDIAKYGVPTPLPVITTQKPTDEDKQNGLIKLNLPPSEILMPSDFSTTSNFLADGAARSWLNTDVAIPRKAEVLSFWAWFVAKGTVDFQIWRPDPKQNGVFQLLAKKQYTADTEGLHGIRLKDNERILVKQGDVLGFANPGESSIIGHHFEAVPLLFAEEGLTARAGENITFDSLLFPYKFAYALTYVKVDDPTPDPDPVVPSPRPAASTDEEDDWLPWLEDKKFLLAMLLWLVLLTLLFIGLCCYIVLKKDKKKTYTGYKRYSNRYSYGESVTPSFNTAYNTLEVKKSTNAESVASPVPSTSVTEDTSPRSPTPAATPVPAPAAHVTIPALSTGVVPVTTSRGSISGHLPIAPSESGSFHTRYNLNSGEPLSSTETLAYVNPVIRTPPMQRDTRRGYYTSPRPTSPRSAGTVATVYCNGYDPSDVSDAQNYVNRNFETRADKATHF